MYFEDFTEVIKFNTPSLLDWIIGLTLGQTLFGYQIKTPEYVLATGGKIKSVYECHTLKMAQHAVKSIFCRIARSNTENGSVWSLRQRGSATYTCIFEEG